MAKSPYRFTRYIAKAAALVREPARALQLARQAAAKLDSAGGTVDQVRGDLLTMVAMLRAWARGDYKGVSTKALLSIAAGVLYFVSPLDAIPDFLFGVGLVDDVAVIGYVVKQVRSELLRFRHWQAHSVSAEVVEQAQANKAIVDDSDEQGSSEG